MGETPRLGARLVPSLLVRDLAATLDFYRALGFERTGAWPDSVAPTWAEVRRDEAVLQFHTEPPAGTPATPTLSGTLYLFPDDVLALADEWRGKVEFAWGPEVQDYGQREFAVRDPDGYLIAFAEPVGAGEEREL